MIQVAETSTTDALEGALKQVKPDGLKAYFAEHREALVQGKRPFMEYMNERLRERGRTKQEIILAADLPEKYGYRLLEEERHTQKRDIYLRLAYGAGLSLKETQRALRLAGQEELYARIPRDAALIVGLEQKMKVDAVNDMLLCHGFDALQPCGENE